jgi:murein DD-endopeptidase MepM/ murein hydrolase activator NlpD
VDKEIRSFRKTLKSFDKINSTLQKGSITSKTGRRMRKVTILIVTALIMILLFLPPFRLPVDGAATSGFFLRQRPESSFVLDLEVHKGIDLAAPHGTRVIASAPGRVVETGFSESYGNYVRIRHLFGFETRYAHLSEITVEQGSFVFLRPFKQIGRVGSTGRSTGPHLHFETRIFGYSLPPRFLLVFHGLRKAFFGF